MQNIWTFNIFYVSLQDKLGNIFYCTFHTPKEQQKLYEMNLEGSKFSTPIFVFQVVTGTAGMSIGASGALFTILGIYGTLMPESKWSIIFLPMYSFTAENGIKGKYRH